MHVLLKGLLPNKFVISDAIDMHFDILLPHMNSLLCSEIFFGSQTIKPIKYAIGGNLELEICQCYKYKVLYGIYLLEFGYQINIDRVRIG